MFTSKEDKNDTKQDISQKNIGGEAKATIMKASVININNFYGSLSDTLETKKFEEGDINTWEKDENVISIEDINMIKGILRNESEIKEAIPLISSMKVAFELLPKLQKGDFIIAIQTIIKEDKIKEKLKKYRELTTPPKEEFSEELIKLMDELSEENKFFELFSEGVYSDYKKIYNIIRCGDLKNKVILYIEDLKKKYKGEIEKTKEEFLRYWWERLTNHPYCVFVSGQRAKFLELEISSKFNNKEKEPVKVFARKDERIVMANLVCLKIAKENSYTLEEEGDYIGYDKSKIFTFLCK